MKLGDLSLSLFFSLFTPPFVSLSVSNFLSLYPSICLCLCFSLSLPLHLSRSLSLFFSLFTPPFVSLSVSVFLSLYPSNCLALCLCFSLYPSICLCFSLSLPSICLYLLSVSVFLCLYPSNCLSLSLSNVNMSVLNVFVELPSGQVVTALHLPGSIFTCPNNISCTFLIIDLKNPTNRSPGWQPYCGFSVTRCHFQSPGAIGRPLSSNPANVTCMKFK